MDTTSNTLTAERVDELFTLCGIKEEETWDDAIAVDGLIMTLHFHPERIEQYDCEIRELLAELSDDFRGEGGASLLDARYDQHGNQWTRELGLVDELVMLGIAIGAIKFREGPRKDWGKLPGGKPYVIMVQ